MLINYYQIILNYIGIKKIIKNKFDKNKIL